jgi:RNA polymerase sigma factor (sigma-70 family)
LRAIGETSSDAQLVAAIRAGDDHAFERLYGRYHRRIAAYVHGMVGDHARAEDVTQEVFLSALRRLRATDQPIAFKPWVYEIAKNACIDQFRRARRAEEVSFDADDALGSGDHRRLTTTRGTPEAAVDQKLALDNLRGAFGGLSETHHDILVMRELEGLSYRQIGDRLGMSRPAVESTLFRARRRLTEEYEELVTGRRCERVRGIIASASEGSLGLRDQRRMARHISYCQPCRHQARLAGVDVGTLERRRVRERIAALLPLPAFLRRRWLPDDLGHPDLSVHAAAVSQWAPIASIVDPSTGSWIKAAAAAATIAVTGVGAGAATMQGPPAERPGLPGSSLNVLDGASWRGHDRARGAQVGGGRVSGLGASTAIGTALPVHGPTVGTVSVGLPALAGSTAAARAKAARPIVLVPAATVPPTPGSVINTASGALPPGAVVPPVTPTAQSPTTTVAGAIQTVTDPVQQALPPAPAGTDGASAPGGGAGATPGTDGSHPGGTGSAPGSVPGAVSVPGVTGPAPDSGSAPGGAGAAPEAGGSGQTPTDRVPRTSGTTSVPSPAPPPPPPTPTQTAPRSTPGSDGGNSGTTPTTPRQAPGSDGGNSGTTPTPTQTTPRQAPGSDGGNSGTTPTPTTPRQAPGSDSGNSGTTPTPTPTQTTQRQAPGSDGGNSGTTTSPAPSGNGGSGGAGTSPPAGSKTTTSSPSGPAAGSSPSHTTPTKGTTSKPAAERTGGS